jgi:DNA-binding transcriptional LysR family regulator
LTLIFLVIKLQLQLTLTFTLLAATSLDKGAAILHNAIMFDWNDIKHFLAVAQLKSTIAAGKHLGVSQTTVHRRLDELEKRLGQKLVARHPEGYRLTDYGSALLPYAERIGAACADLERHIHEKSNDLSGVIRVTCPEPIVQLLQKSQLLARFQTRYPLLNVQFISNDRYVDILKGEADIALRSGDTDEELVGRTIAESVWSIFASYDYINGHGAPQKLEDLNAHKLVVFDAAKVPHRSVQWFKEVAPNATIVSTHTSVLGLIAGIKSGLGLGAIPKVLGDREADLVCVIEKVPALLRPWRILTHPDLRQVPRIAAFFDFIVASKEDLKTILG